MDLGERGRSVYGAKNKITHNELVQQLKHKKKEEKLSMDQRLNQSVMIFQTGAVVTHHIHT